MSLTTLRVILDQVGDPTPSGIGRYALELTRALIETAPRGCDVAGIVASSPPSEYEQIEQQLPGLSDLFKSAFDRRQLAAAWQHGFTRLPGTGMVHAPSLLAPLYRHDRLNTPGEQIVVTIHDAAAWTHPETLPTRTVTYTRAMAKRAERYADAIVVPTHAVANELSDLLTLGDRVRVIGAAVSRTLDPGSNADSDARADALGLPDRYVLAVGELERHNGMHDLLWAWADTHAPDVPLVIAGMRDDRLADLEHLAHLEPGHILPLGVLDETDLAVAYTRAAAVVVPSLAGASDLVALEAMSLGAPVVHSDAPALLEVCSDAGIIVARDDIAGYPRRLADAVRTVLDDPELAAELRVRGRDRARAYSWRDSAEKTWQLHADL